MKCLESEKLIGYAYRLSDEGEALQVRAHLRECSRCRDVVEAHGRLDAVLSEWNVGDPTLGFDARVRQAVEVQQARRAAWRFWGWQWAHGLALASLGAMIVAGLVWFTYSQVGRSHSSSSTARQHRSPARPQTSPQNANLYSPAVPVHPGAESALAPSQPQSDGVALNQDKDAQALEDYDLAANFDLLSELPKGEPRVAN